jgi:hypothetical protein
MTYNQIGNSRVYKIDEDGNKVDVDDEDFTRERFMKLAFSCGLILARVVFNAFF